MDLIVDKKKIDWPLSCTPTGYQIKNMAGISQDRDVFQMVAAYDNNSNRILDDEEINLKLPLVFWTAPRDINGG